MHGTKAPSELRHIQTFKRATLVYYEISVNFNRFKGQKMWVLPSTSWPKLTNMSIFCGVMPKNGRHQHTEQKNQRQEYYDKAALLNTYKSLQSCKKIK